jgi:hypothetical protein
MAGPERTGKLRVILEKPHGDPSPFAVDPETIKVRL